MAKAKATRRRATSTSSKPSSSSTKQERELAERFWEHLSKLSPPEQRQFLARELYPAKWWEVPCSIEEFVTSPDYLNMGGQVWPSIREELAEVFEPDADGDFRYNEVVLLKAIGAGKSMTSSIIFAYLVYWVLCLRDPQSYFGLAAGSKIAFLNIAPSAQKAKDIVFHEVKTRVENSPWFSRYYPPDPRVKSKLLFDHVEEDDAGRSLGGPATGRKNVAIIPGNSSRNAAIGYNVFGGVIDEAAFFETMENIGKVSTERTDVLYDAIQRRIFSRFGKRGMLVMISSPQYADDFIEKKHEEGKTNPRLYAVRKALWDAKPRGTYSSEVFRFEAEVEGVKRTLLIPTDFKAEFAKNPHKALRDLAALPSLALNPYMGAGAVDEVAEGSKLKSPVVRESEMGLPLEFAPWFKPTRFQRAIHIDLAKTRDACGFAMGYWDSERQRAVFELLVQIRTSREKPLDFQAVRDLVLHLRAMGFSFYRVSYDNFQSVDSIQLLQRKGIEAEHLSVDTSLEPYDTLLGFVNSGEADFYPHPVLTRELKRLELVNGKKVDHPPHGTKDLADAVAGVAYWVGHMRAGVGQPQQKVIINKGGRMAYGRL